MLILNEPNKIFNASTCGDNCAKWILEIGKKQDITINLRHMMDFGIETKFDIFIKNGGEIVHSMKELIPIAHQYLNAERENHLDDLEMAKKRDHKIMITNEAINKVPRIQYKEIPKTEYDNLRELARQVLQISKKENFRRQKQANCGCTDGKNDAFDFKEYGTEVVRNER